MAKAHPVSPLAPASFPDLPVIRGVRFATAEAGVRYKNRTDVMLALLDPGTSVAGVFTRSATRSAPVRDCQAKIGGDASEGAAILVNSGNSNAFTGHRGETSVGEIVKAVAEVAGVPAARVFTASTGVIGEPLPHDRITAKLRDLASTLAPDAMPTAARAIMTTDTFPKGAARQVEIGGQTVSIAGIAKGSGMIAPDMATMLVYIFTDAKVEQGVLQKMLGAFTDTTFNCITVDSDTSTSDSLMLCATGASGVDATGEKEFDIALHEVMLDLAQQVVRDGEGRDEVRRGPRDRSRKRSRRQAACDVHRELSTGQDRHRRRGSELGPRGHGHRQVRSRRGPGPAVDLVRRHPRGRQGLGQPGVQGR